MLKFKTKQQIENCLFSDLNSMIQEFDNDILTKESILNYFSLFMRGAEVDSKITVNVLEKFGTLGKEEALCIKINEGW